jgi:hypothetical protein
MADHPFTGTLSVTGNVGIGAEPLPTAQLYTRSPDPLGQILVENAAGTLLKLAVDGSGAAIGTETGTTLPLSLQTNGTSRLSINNAGAIAISGPLTVQNALSVTGNVTIGTVPTPTTLTVPGTIQAGSGTFTGPLTVQNTLTVTGNMALNSGTLQVTGGAITPASGNSQSAGILFPQNPGGGSGDAAWMRYYPRSGEACTLEIGISNDANDHIALLPSGNVGIGTTEPQGKLDVRGAIYAGNSDIYFTQTDHNHTAIGNTAGFAAIENSANYAALMILGRAGTPQGRAVKLWDYLQVNGNLEVTGNVGIGTASPDRRLVVRGGETSLEQEAWQNPSFQNGWVNYDTTYNAAGYFKDSLGIIHLRGLVKNGSGVLFTLPAGYRPPRRELFAVATHPNTVGRIDILADGQVLMVSGSNLWISLDGITFKAGSARVFPIDGIRFPIGQIGILNQ